VHSVGYNKYRPDIIIKNKKEKTCTLIDVAIPADRNVVRMEAEKNLKYKSLCIEIQRMWNLKCTIVPVITGATGLVTSSLKKNAETIPRKHSIDSLQKTAILGTSQIIRKVLQCEARSLSGGDHYWFKRSTRKKKPVTETSISYNNNNNNNNNNITSQGGKVTILWNQQRTTDRTIPSNKPNIIIRDNEEV